MSEATSLSMDELLNLQTAVEDFDPDATMGDMPKIVQPGYYQVVGTIQPQKDGGEIKVTKNEDGSLKTISFAAQWKIIAAEEGREGEIGKVLFEYPNTHINQRTKTSSMHTLYKAFMGKAPVGLPLAKIVHAVVQAVKAGKPVGVTVDWKLEENTGEKDARGYDKIKTLKWGAKHFDKKENGEFTPVEGEMETSEGTKVLQTTVVITNYLAV